MNNNSTLKKIYYNSKYIPNTQALRYIMIFHHWPRSFLLLDICSKDKYKKCLIFPTKKVWPNHILIDQDGPTTTEFLAQLSNTGIGFTYNIFSTPFFTDFQSQLQSIILHE